MILICVADCLQLGNVVDYKYYLNGLPVDFDEYLCILYEFSFIPSLFLCHCNFFNNDFCLVTRIWASSLYSCLGFIFFSPLPQKKKKKKSIWLLKEIKFKLESQTNYIVGERKQKYLNFYNIIRLHAWDLLWSFSQNFTLNY
ncbi:hypothetical protein ACB092_10G087000 [Castanea dentata]